MDLFASGENQPSDRTLFSVCNVCAGKADDYIKRVRRGDSEDEIKRKVVADCINFRQSRRVCEGLANLNVPPLMYIIQQRPNLNGNFFCAFVLHNANCMNSRVASAVDFKVAVDENQPMLSGSKDTSATPFPATS